MHKFFRLFVAVALISGSASLATAGDLKLTLSNGRVTLIATDVPLGQILDEWARVGKTTIVNGDKLSGPPLTLQLVDRPEREVLDLLLRSASGYIAAQRQVSIADASVFDRVMILPVSHGPVGVTANTPPTPFNNRPLTMQQMPMPMPVQDDDNPVVEPQVAPPGTMPNMPAGVANVPGVIQGPANGQASPVMTSPRPGMLPAPPQGQPNPYGPPTVPGTIVPNVPGTIPPPFVRPGGPGGPGGERE